MDLNEENQDSLSCLVRTKIAKYDTYPSIQRLVCTVRDLETNFDNLEKRLQQVKDEIKIFICEQEY